MRIENCFPLYDWQDVTKKLPANGQTVVIALFLEFNNEGLCFYPKECIYDNGFVNPGFNPTHWAFRHK